MRVPLSIHPGDGTILEEVRGLGSALVQALHAINIDVLFPVQSVVWEATSGGFSTLHDICLEAPTGSGKTLAYGLPILRALAHNSMPHLQALVVLPTRDLALQVFSVFRPLCSALQFNCVVACGATSVAVEAEALSCGGVDIVIATPGRLTTHLQGTPALDLRRLKFLVVDEADRLLRQNYQGWLQKVLVAAGADDQYVGLSSMGTRRVVKFIVSATLTKDPSKIDRLDLVCPRYVAMIVDDHKYKLPPGLAESKLVVPAGLKIAALVVLLQNLLPAPVVVFTSSVESTRRLSFILKSLSHLIGSAVEYNAAMQPSSRKSALDAFRSGGATVMVCSDAMTRGMDVEGVEAVINYDAPVYAKTYVHRAGRTARAGRAGRVITLLRPEDVRHFKGMLRKADNNFVKDEKLDGEKVAAVKEDVARAVALLEQGEVGALGEDIPTQGQRGGADNEERREYVLKRRKIRGVQRLTLLTPV